MHRDADDASCVVKERCTAFREAWLDDLLSHLLLLLRSSKHFVRALAFSATEELTSHAGRLRVGGSEMLGDGQVVHPVFWARR